MIIRPARVEDAGEACNVLHRSIEVLCTEDHARDASAIEQWLANKTPERVLSWISDCDQLVVLAEDHGRILGVGAAVKAGEITLNYVSPEARFSGVSKALLRELEAYLRVEKNELCRLLSTRTAYRFYRAAGYEDAGPSRIWGKLSAHPMIRRINAADEHRQ